MSNLLDTDMLEELREIMEDDFDILMETFLAESAKQFQSIQDAWQASDVDQLRRSAHSLKGSCGNIGAISLQEHCANLEHAARDEQLDNFEAMLAQVENTLQEVCAEIKRL
ncbi:MAG: Hpt domain-containing protein [Pseudomonadota bacterium]